MPLRFFTATKTGEIQSRLANDVGGVQHVVTETAPLILMHIVVLVSTVGRYGVGVAWPAAHPSQGSPDPPAPPPEPRAIRACLTPDVAAEFDREWEIVLDQAKRDQDLELVHDLLAKWRHFAYTELKAPGTYFRMLATAAQTLATGQAPAGSVSGEEITELIRRRLGRRWHFGPSAAGQLIYLIAEDLREVHVLLVQWLGPADA